MIPTSGAPPSSSGTRTSESPTGLILVVEDDPGVRRVVEAILRRAGFTVLLAENGVHGMDLWRTHRDRVALVLTDQAMPRMGGVEMVQALREELPRLPCVLMTGGALAGDENQCLPGITVLPKPFSAEELGAAVREALPSLWGERGGRP